MKPRAASMDAHSRMHWEAHFQRCIRCICLIGIAALASACAALPEVQYLNSALRAPTNPTVTNAHGTLSTSKSSELLTRRWRSAQVAHTDMVESASLEEAATGSPLIAGNKVTLLHDGPQTMAAMTEAIRAARDHINLETYIFDQEALGMEFAELLMARQRDGVQVNVIYDSVGTLGTPQAFFDKMRTAGIRLLAFNPVNPLKLLGPWTPNNRDHRKILIVDGNVAFTGGVNISNNYATSSLFRSKSRRDAVVGWRDTHVRIEGPAVAALQTVFLSSWASQNFPQPAGGHFFPPLTEAGDKLVRVLASETGGDHEIYKAYVLAIQKASETVHITSAYFVPDAQILQALIDTARRGVDVKIILPGVSDSGLVLHAAQSFYGEMLASGIRIYQLQVAVLHAKTAVIDRYWSTVGSTNIDTRSFLHNNEINVMVFGAEFGNAMEQAFSEDLRHSIEIHADEWAQRPLGDKFKEWAARRLAYWL